MPVSEHFIRTKSTMRVFLLISIVSAHSSEDSLLPKTPLSIMLMQADRQNLHDLKDQAQGVKHSDHHSDDEAERSATGRGFGINYVDKHIN